MKTLRDQLSKQNINIDQTDLAVQLSDQEIAAVSGGAYEENAAVQWFAKAVLVIKF